MENIFELLNWILRKTKSFPIDENDLSLFMLNRWLSMANSDVAKIVNLTYNRWNISKDEYDRDHVIRFYQKIIPKYTKRITYIKKTKKVKDKEAVDDITVCQNLEISKKELIRYNKLLEDLKT